MPRLENFSKNALWASSSRNRREIGLESKDEEAPDRRGFRAGVVLCLGAIDTTNVNKIERGKKETIRKTPKQFKYNKYIEKIVRMHEKCMNM